MTGFGKTAGIYCGLPARRPFDARNHPHSPIHTPSPMPWPPRPEGARFAQSGSPISIEGTNDTKGRSNTTDRVLCPKPAGSRRSQIERSNRSIHQIKKGGLWFTEPAHGSGSLPEINRVRSLVLDHKIATGDGGARDLGAALHTDEPGGTSRRHRDALGSGVDGRTSHGGVGAIDGRGSNQFNRRRGNAASATDDQAADAAGIVLDRKSTRLNSSH